MIIVDSEATVPRMLDNWIGGTLGFVGSLTGQQGCGTSPFFPNPDPPGLKNSDPQFT